MGNPLAITTTAANGDERQEVAKLINQVEALSKRKLKKRVIILKADKGYDARWLRQKLLNSNIIPYRKMKGRNTLTMNEICEILRYRRKGGR